MNLHDAQFFSSQLYTVNAVSVTPKMEFTMTCFCLFNNLRCGFQTLSIGKECFQTKSIINKIKNKEMNRNYM